MANASVDGLISGLSTSDVITQLMQLERQPQVRLQTQRKALDSTTAIYQNLNTRFDSLLKSASALTSADGWQAMQATSSDTNRLQATAAPDAIPAELSISVEHLATTHTMASEVAVAGLDAVVATGPVTFTINGTPATPIDVGDGKLSSVVTAINAAKIGVRAAAVQVTPGHYRLQLSASTSGAEGSFTVDPTPLAALANPLEPGPDPEAFDIITAGTDAEILVGGPGGYSVTSASNTFSDLLPGVDLTAVKADPGVVVAISVAPDPDALADKVSALVTSVNTALKTIADATTFDPKTGNKGALLGDSMARQLQQQLYEALRIDLPGGSLADVGMKLGAAGIEFDRDKFAAAFTKDPDRVIDAFTGGSTALAGDGLAAKLADVGRMASNTTTGLVTTAIKSTGDRAASYDKEIADWDVRLADREATLRRQYSAMEVALGNLKNQSTWLAGQISGLPSWG